VKSYKLVKKKKIQEVTSKLLKNKPDEIISKVIHSGICGSDLSVYLGKHPYKKAPVVLGHEFLGKVQKVGKKIKNVKKDDLITSLPYDFCGECVHCKKGLTNHCNNKTTPSYKKWNGTFAEYFLSKKNSTYKLNKKINLLDGVMIEPFAICCHAIKLILDKKIKNSLILGAGNIGLATLMLAKNNKRFQKIGIVDIHSSRNKIAKEIGANYFIKYSSKDFSKKITKKNPSESIDIIFITCDYKNVINDAINIIKPKGTIVIISYFKDNFNIDYNLIVKKEIIIKGSFLSTIKDFKEVEKMILKKKLNPKKIISNIYPLKKINYAFDQMHNNRSNNLKIILKNEK
jgi:L-iditol 2-dehydrogenase